MGQAASSSQRPDSSPAQYSVPFRNSDRDATMNSENLFEPTLDNEQSHQQNGASDQRSLSGHPVRFQPFASQPMDDDVSMHSVDADQEPETGSLADLRNEDSRYTPLLMARRQSTMSRLGSRILPNNVIRGLLNSEEETPAEGHAHRNGRLPRSFSRSEGGRSSRFSPFNSFGSRGITRRRTIRGPYPLLHGDPGLLSDAGSNLPEPPLDDTANPGRSWSRSARLARMRTSLPAPISDIFGSPPTLPTIPSNDLPMTAPQPLRPATPVGMDRLLPPPIPTEARVDREQGEERDSVDPSPWNNRSPSPTASARGPSDPPPGGQFPRLVRTQSTQSLRREEQTPLSRVLQLAASAIAAQLSGSANPSPLNLQSLGNTGLTASLDSLVQSLQQITSTQGRNTPPPPGDGSGGQPTAGNPTPFNFLRVFRFANSAGSSRPQGATENDNHVADRMDLDEQPTNNNNDNNNNETTEGRTVTLVVVGVRLVSRHPPDQQAPVSLDGQSQHTTASLDSRSPPSAVSSGGANAAISDSPPGPSPPPSTPAEPSLSAPPSGTTTPSGRPSTASSAAPNITPQASGQPSRPLDTAEPTDPNASAIPGAQQRRRSDTEQARHREFGSGAARRNGIVEPDHPPSTAGRTWVIYVVGTNLSENHPAVATPSLFTDNPTYEDLVLLSSLLGPAKPPVATKEDVASSGGVFRLVEYAGSLVAEAVEGSDRIPIAEGDRCLICLSDYEAAEEIRQLARCKHLFHKDCIDQWLTTGRNSCPLCRGQGVPESSNSTNPPTSQPTASAPA
ncbi:hypothetical protein VTN49DRAFT_4226 [Thermomyces lanuginosus]|uniref:uncharacterized protein n=1 Tax=Thermomyces lanuginosus TaxID=5541 RepID=UPI0037425AF7